MNKAIDYSCIRLILLCVIGIITSPTLMAECASPTDYVRKVFSSQQNVIEYELDQSIKYHDISVIFYGKRGHVLRRNTEIKLDSPKGKFVVPNTALIKPPQSSFNFVITDDEGCKRWGLVNEMPISGEGNLIGINNPSNEGEAFYLK